jgi:hypothetical protein
MLALGRRVEEDVRVDEECHARAALLRSSSTTRSISSIVAARLVVAAEIDCRGDRVSAT